MKPADKILVMIAFDQILFREGLAAVLNKQGRTKLVEQLDDLQKIPDAIRRHRPNVLVIDSRVKGIDSADAIDAAHRDFPSVSILVLSSSDGSEDIYRALRAGARGYLLKDSTDTELMRAIEALNAGRRHISLEMASRLAERMDCSTLTKREMEVLQLIVSGKSNKEIAAALSVSEETIKYHVKSILSKLGVSDRTQAATAALLRGIIHRNDV